MCDEVIEKKTTPKYNNKTIAIIIKEITVLININQKIIIFFIYFEMLLYVSCGMNSVINEMFWSVSDRILNYEIVFVKKLIWIQNNFKNNYYI